MFLCPCCDREMQSPVGVKDLAYAGLAPQEKIVLDALIKAHPKPATMRSLVSSLYDMASDGGPLNPEQVVRVRVLALRKRLMAFGWTIPKAQGGRGHYGQYRLERVTA